MSSLFSVCCLKFLLTYVSLLFVLLFIRCDDCKKFYHFPCLDPPAKKTPKVKGYKWFCPDCDQSSSESESDSSSEEESDDDEEDQEESEEQPKKTNGNREDSSSDSDSYESADEAINLTKQK